MKQYFWWLLLLVFTEELQADQCQLDYDRLTIDPKNDVIAFESQNDRHRGRVKLEILSSNGQTIIQATVKHSSTGLNRILFSKPVPTSKDLAEFSEKFSMMISDYYVSMSYYQYAPSPLIKVRTKNHTFLNHENFASEISLSMEKLARERRVSVSFDW